MSIKTLIETAKARDPTKIGALCQRCYTLVAQKEQIINPMTVVKLNIPIVGFNTDPRLMAIHNHLCARPWRILNKFVLVHKHSPSVSILLVSSIKRKLRAGEPLCHVSFIQPEEALYDIKGKLNIYLTTLKIFFIEHIFIYIFLFFCRRG